jgi:hypothetical protein
MSTRGTCAPRPGANSENTLGEAWPGDVYWAKKSPRRSFRRGDLQIKVSTTLADLGPHRAAIALEAHLATGKQIGHRSNRFSGALGAGTDGYD